MAWNIEIMSSNRCFNLSPMTKLRSPTACWALDTCLYPLVSWEKLCLVSNLFLVLELAKGCENGAVGVPHFRSIATHHHKSINPHT